jgi:enolase
VIIGMDVAASEFYKADEKKYDLDFKKYVFICFLFKNVFSPNSDKTKWLTGDQLTDLYKLFITKYNVKSIEDAFDQDDWENWSKLLAQTDIQLVGDDLTVTNPKRIKQAVEKKACNCLLLKVL